MSDARNRPGAKTGDDESKGSDNRRGKHANVGFPGKLQVARTVSPDGATGEEINTVAWIAFEEDRDPADVWAERTEGEQ